jgi:hypothetical protein
MCANGQAPQTLLVAFALCRTRLCCVIAATLNRRMLRRRLRSARVLAPNNRALPRNGAGATICWSPRRTDVTLPASDRDLSSLARVAMRVLYLV